MTRLLSLLSLLQAPREWPGGELARRLGVSLRTVRRDVERLRALGYPVEATMGAAGGYRLGAGAAMPPLLLEDEEAVAIAVGLRGATGGSVAGIEESALRALAKLEQVLPDRLRRRVAALHTETVVLDRPSAGPVVDPEVLTVLAAACRDHERVRFAYRDREERLSRRLVEPHTLVAASRRWYLLAFDLEREDWRTFRVDRLAEVHLTGVRVAPRALPEGEDAAGRVRRSLAAERPAGRAVLLVHAPAAEVADRLRVSPGELEPVDEDTCLLRTAADALEWTALRVAYLGVDFEVREPPELAALLRETGMRLVRAAG